jgi:oligopeptide transport system substrate-binding protein
LRNSTSSDRPLCRLGAGARQPSARLRGAALRTVLPLVLLAIPAVFAAWTLAKSRLPPADFTFNNGTEIETLDPAIVTGVPEGRVMRALFEGLTVKHPQTLEALPGMAERWELSPDSRTYTFHIRRGALWSNGDPVTAHDFVWSWQRCLDPRTGSKYAYQLWYVRGAEAWSKTIDDAGRPTLPFDTVGIRATDDHTLVVELAHPTAFFLELTSFYPLFPVNRRNIEEAQREFPGDAWRQEWLRPERIVTNGPYRIAFRRVNDRLRLVKYADYWDADAVAFDTIDLLAVESYMTALNLYLQGDVHWIDRAPNTLVPELLAREDFAPAPYFGTYFYRVNVTRPPLDDARVRRALALTIDRKKICERITKAGQIPWFSIVPYGMPGYAPVEMPHRADVHGDWDATFQQDCEEAVRILAEAGYGPGLRPLPTIEIHYNTSETHKPIAEVIADSWQRHLGATTKLANQEWKVFQATQTALEFDVSRSAWIGDYLDPNTFVDLFVTNGENNKTGWGDPRYDELVARASREPDPAQRFELFREAEALLMQELPILPVYSYVTQNVIDPRVGGAPPNLLDEYFWKWVYLRSDEELAAERARRPADFAAHKRVVESRGPANGIYPANAPNGRFPVGDPRRELSPLAH